MKKSLPQIALLLLLSFSFMSCSKEEAAPNQSTAPAQVNAKFNYTSEELEVLALINNYRVSKGLNALEKVDYISTISESHDKYMIQEGKPSHDNFYDRFEALSKNLGAKNVSENVAYNYSSPQSVFNAWMASDGHRSNIEGNYTHFGIAIRANAEGKKYYTNLFMFK
nr:CAP domain-containing protein [Flavobacterium sp. H122]